MEKQTKLFCFGLGYSASFLVKRLQETDTMIRGTTQTEEKYQQLENAGIEPHLYSPHHDLLRAEETLAGTTHIVISIPPSDKGCPVFNQYVDIIAGLPDLQWLGYLSTTGVYGDNNGEWVDEETLPNPPRASAEWRLIAEKQWLEACKEKHVPTHIFRLSGIYGPKRSVLEKLRAGDTDHIVKLPDPVSRIHAEDIAQVLYASMEQPYVGEIYNVSDDMPAPSHEVAAYAAEILGVDLPLLVEPDEEMKASGDRKFFRANRKISNKKIKVALGIELQYPSYKQGLKAIAQEYEVGMLLAHLLKQA